MKICLLANYLPDAQQSMQRYARFLKQELTKRGHDVTVIQPPIVFGRVPLSSQTMKKWLGYLDKYLLFPATLGSIQRKVDLVHICDHSNAIYSAYLDSRKCLITCHDLLAIKSAQGAFPENPTSGTGKLLQKWIVSGLRRLRHFVCVSAKTRDDLLAILSEKPVTLDVIHLSLNWPYHPAPLGDVPAELARLGLDTCDEYLLHVGGNQWYKNRAGVLEIYRHLRSHFRFQKVGLIMVGEPLPPWEKNFCQTHGLSTYVAELDGPSNEVVQGLYSSALALLFPSKEEGFGWPILEAQASGCPVITTGRPPMSEVAGDAALFIDPADPAAAAKKIAENVSALALLREKGLANAALFISDRTLSAYEEAYRKVLVDVRG
jgi:glycosyltransferase involved in cell wall biosynthesis